MFNSWVRFSVLVSVAMGALVGCGSCTAQDRDNGKPVGLGAPPELRGARLLFQRADGIHLHILGQHTSKRMVADATWPSWAPDGQSFAFVRGNRILRFDLRDRSEQPVAEAARARAVAYHPDGQHILFTDGKSIKSAPVRGGAATVVATGPEFLELDVARTGGFLAATVKSFGYRIRRYELSSGKPTEIGRGCSASISPDGRLITVNLDDHTRLALFDSQTGQARGWVQAPPGLKLDNQKWSNHPDWIAAVVEGKRQDILVQRVRDGQAWRVTDAGDADRPDLFVE